MPTLTSDDQELLGAIARHEVLRDGYDGYDYRWHHPHGGGLPERVAVERAAITRLDGLIELPSVTEWRVDRYWDLTDAATTPTT